MKNQEEEQELVPNVIYVQLRDTGTTMYDPSQQKTILLANIAEVKRTNFIAEKLKVGELKLVSDQVQAAKDYAAQQEHVSQVAAEEAEYKAKLEAKRKEQAEQEEAATKQKAEDDAKFEEELAAKRKAEAEEEEAAKTKKSPLAELDEEEESATKTKTHKKK
jgi:hypothetical protein